MLDQSLLESVAELAIITESCIDAAIEGLTSDIAIEAECEILVACSSCIDMLIMAADTAQLTALKQLCDIVQNTLTSINPITLINYPNIRIQISDWSRAVQIYLRQPNVNGITPALLALIPIEQQENLLLALSDSQIIEPANTASQLELNSNQLCSNDNETLGSNSINFNDNATDQTIDVTSASNVENLQPQQQNTPFNVEPSSPQINTTVFAELDAPLAALTIATTADEIYAASNQYSVVLKQIATTIVGPGAKGLNVICEILRENLNKFSNLPDSTRNQLIALLIGWPSLAEQYLIEPSNSDLHTALLTLVTDNSWPRPVTPAQTEDFLVAIKQDTNQTHPPPPVQPADVALVLDPGLNSKLITAFFQEAPLNVADFTAALGRMLHGENLSQNLSLARRLAHNLKGSANILGIKGLANLTHRIEDILDYLTEKQQLPIPDLARTLQEAADCLEDMMDALQSNAATPTAATRVLQELLTWTWRIEVGQYATYQATSDKINITTALAESITTLPQPIDSETQVKTIATPKISSANIKTAVESAPAPLNAEIASAPLLEQKVLRVATATIDYIFKMVSELSIATDQLRDRIQLLKSRHNELQSQNNLIQQRRFEVENFIDARYVIKKKKSSFYLIKEEENLNTTEINFDPLELRQYNELHNITGDFIETVVDARRISQHLRTDLNKLEHLIAPMRQMQHDLQSTVMRMRMEPVETISARLQRSVRHACRATGKEVTLHIEGEATLIDSEMLDRLADPIMHILRNAVDHGIETADKRTIKGKTPHGNIRLRFFHEGQSIIVLCNDDGAGLDYAKIRAIGIDRGFAVHNATNQELARLIMEPGFSTHSDNVTQISGRGVGMDVVQTAVRAMRGSVNISDAEGGGCQFTLRLPLTLITLHCLIVEIKAQLFAIPTNTIIRTLSPGAGKFIAIGSQMAYEIGLDTYPATALAVRLNLAAQEIDELKSDKAVLLVQTDIGLMAIAIDQLSNIYNLVLKSLGRYIPAIRGISGLATLADGTLLPVLNLSELINTKTHHAQHSAATCVQKNLPTTQILIVDDSLSVRQSLTILMEDAGYQSSIARDGMEAVEILQQGLPNLILCDIEMPRMNGFELVNHIRIKYGTQLPIIMLTSRTSPKHRQQAAQVGANVYFTKPFNKDELLITMSNLLKV